MKKKKIDFYVGAFLNINFYFIFSTRKNYESFEKRLYKLGATSRKEEIKAE